MPAATYKRDHDDRHDNDRDDDRQYLDPARRPRGFGLGGRGGIGHPHSSVSVDLAGSVEFTRQRVAVKSDCLAPSYSALVPKVWKDTIEEHRRAVRDATMEAAATLVAEHGLRSVTMSQIAEETGIGRATLYKYFSDIESILQAWHERRITEHLNHLSDVRDQARSARERLEAVLEAYALISHESRPHHDTELAALMHREQHVARAEQRLRRMIGDLITEAQRSGDVRDDVTRDELVDYCLHALTAANSLSSKAAVRRLVLVTLSGLRPIPG